MLPRKHRLSKPAEVKKTTARGRSFFNPYFILKISPTTEKTPKITLITSVRVSKKAVDRNRVKRILRDELRKHIDNFKSGDYVIIVKKQAVTAEPKELRETLIKSLISAKVLSK